MESTRRDLLGICVAVVASACGASGAALRPVQVRLACALDEHYADGACRAVAGRARLDAGREALAKFEVERANAELDAAQSAGPLDWDSHVALWEQRGIAAAYAEDEPRALSAFASLLALSPGHFLSYTLSPRATFVFEKARLAAQRAPRPAVQLSWRRDARVGDALPVDIEVVADPQGALARATLALRTRGEPSWREIDVTLRPPGSFSRVTLPPISGAAPATVELYLRAFDSAGNEVLRWAAPDAPREVALRYEPPPPWHAKWWVRLVGGGAVLAATATIVYVATREPPGTVGGDVVIR